MRAGRLRLFALIAVALVLIALVPGLHPAARRRTVAPDSTAAESRAAATERGKQTAPRRQSKGASGTADVEGDATAAQMACNVEVANILARRLKSAEVRERPSLAAGAVLIDEHLSLLRAVATQSRLPPPGVSALERAMRSSPNDALLARLYATRCRAPRCDSRAAFARLVALEPDNLATWMLDLHDESRPTAAEDDAWLAHAARSIYFDPHYSELAFAVLETAHPMPPVPACDGPLRAIDPGREPQPADVVAPLAQAIASMQLPMNLRFWNACQQRKLLPGRQANCQKVHVLLAGSTELMYANGSLRWLAAHAQPQSERAKWFARWRELQWAMQAGAGAALNVGTLPLMLEQGEIPVLIGHLEEHGQWPPPHNWQPPAIQ